MNQSHHHVKSDLDELKEVGRQLEKLLIQHGVTEDQLLTEFRELRKKSKANNTDYS